MHIWLCHIVFSIFLLFLFLQFTFSTIFQSVFFFFLLIIFVNHRRHFRSLLPDAYINDNNNNKKRGTFFRHFFFLALVLFILCINILFHLHRQTEFTIKFVNWLVWCKYEWLVLRVHEYLFSIKIVVMWCRLQQVYYVHVLKVSNV